MHGPGYLFSLLCVALAAVLQGDYGDYFKLAHVVDHVGPARLLEHAVALVASHSVGVALELLGHRGFDAELLVEMGHVVGSVPGVVAAEPVIHYLGGDCEVALDTLLCLGASHG